MRYKSEVLVEVCEDSIRFLHLSDTHFGVHYALNPRNPLRREYGELFFRKVEDIIREAIAIHKIDFIIHSGDFFNRSKPPPEIVDRGVKPFQYAARKGIPVFIIPGNHEKSRLPVGLLSFSNDKLNIISKPCSYLFEKNGISIKITGIPYIRYKARNNFFYILKKAWNNFSNPTSTRFDYSILIVHQLFKGSRLENYTFSRGHDVIPTFQGLRKFNYVACGHVHRFQFLYEKKSPFLKSTNKYYLVEQNQRTGNWHFDTNCSKNLQFPKPIIAYAGSLERVSFMERNEPKGYLIGEIKPSNKGYQTLKLKAQFHELSAVKMIYNIWDFSKTSQNECVNQTLERMCTIRSIYKQKKNKYQGSLIGIIKIFIKELKLVSKSSMDFLKEEAKRLGFYLTFRGRTRNYHFAQTEKEGIYS